MPKEETNKMSRQRIPPRREKLQSRHKIFYVAKVTYELQETDIVTDYVTHKELYFQSMDDAKNYVWNEYRNTCEKMIKDCKEEGRNYDHIKIQKFNKNKTEYKYFDGNFSDIRVTIKTVDVNHYPVRFKENGEGYVI